MQIRFENRVYHLLVDKTVAGQEGTLGYLTQVAAKQYFLQTALGYLALIHGKFDKEQILDFIQQFAGSSVLFNFKECQLQLQDFGLLDRRDGKIEDCSEDCYIMTETWERVVEFINEKFKN
eukprot:TRINITY_DN14462_c0_g1_i1.p2 TRINITY_DN14462_c0_g1~~TRINITY_DN14462_c0_g1_i1.p2  ORF type:complete len:121 (+),score=21.75 TRINITY_DN14462_c0_g1_i1:25-387(+)